MFDFDSHIDRYGTDCIKWERQTRACGGEGLDPYWIADSDWAAAPCVVEAIQERARHPIYGYTAPSGEYFQAFCSWFKRRYDWDVQPQWVMPGVGVMTSLALTIDELTEPGGRVVTMTPAYDSFFTAITGQKRTLVTVPLHEEDLRYTIDYQLLEQELQQNARILLLCNPQNPVGRVWTREELERIVELCVRYDVYILSDDSHCDLAARGHKYTPVASLPGADERSILFTAPSKTFNVAGIGASNTIIPNDALRARMSAAFMGRLVRGSNVFAYAVCRAAYGGGEEWLEEQLDYIAGNAAYMQRYIAERIPQIRIAPWEGTFLLWVDFRAFGRTSRELAGLLAQKHRIALGCGSGYGPGGEGFMRINIACPRARLEKLCAELEAFCKDLGCPGF